MTTYVKEIPKIVKRTMQGVKSTTTKTNHNRLLQNIKDSYETATLVIIIVTSTIYCTNRNKQHHTANRNTQNSPGMRKLNNEYDRLY